MSNVKHKNCALRELAKSAKSRLCDNRYDSEKSVPKGATPEQKAIFLKLCQMQKEGETVVNPVACFADQEKMKTLSHEDRQRYILTVCADYVSMKHFVENKARKTG